MAATREWTGFCRPSVPRPNAPEATPGISAAGAMPGAGGDIGSAQGSMNHLTFDVPVDQFDAYVEKLKSNGVEVSRILNHDDSQRTVADDVHAGIFVRSVYFHDPDGILARVRLLDQQGPDDARHIPVDTQGRRNRRSLPI